MTLEHALLLIDRRMYELIVYFNMVRWILDLRRFIYLFYAFNLVSILYTPCVCCLELI
jgi:hypothetical protein